jgi:kumamolisin
MTQHHYHRVHPRLRGIRPLSPHSLPGGSLSPAQVLTAYGFKQNQYAGAAPVKLGVGSLGGGVVQQDIANAVAHWGMAAPHLTVRTVGGAVNDPVSDQDSNVENMLDLLLISYTWWFLTGTPADVTVTFGPNASGGMEAVTRDLVAAGVEVASWSWGSAASNWNAAERASLARALSDAAAANVCFSAASGDNSVDDGTSAPSADYPCADPNVWAVGGTFLAVNPDGSRAEEAAWGDGRPGDEGGGGGFDPSVPTPAWQRGVTTGPGRGVPDTSANADPNSGWQISANGSWTVVGGTSAASPFTAALVAVAKGVAKSAGRGVTTPAVYAARATACNDITEGSNGDPALPGWDAAVGLGSPKGDGFVRAIVDWALGVQPSPPAPVPPGQPGTAVTLDQAVAWASQGVLAGDPMQRQEEAVANLKAGLTAGWPK